MAPEKGLAIEATLYGDCFDTVPPATVFLLDNPTAEAIWSEEIDADSASYFSLPDDSWLVNGTRKIIGRWLESFNVEDVTEISSLLSATTQWPDDCMVRFCVNNKTILTTTWSVFLMQWHGFLCAEDDSPILVRSHGGRKDALIFHGIGNIERVTTRPGAGLSS